MKRSSLLLTFILVLGACTAPATETESTEAASPDVTVAAPVTTTASTQAPVTEPPATEPPATDPPTEAPSGDLNCIEIWPEDEVIDILGEEFSLFSTSDSVDACGYISGPTSVVVAFRIGDSDDLFASMTGADITGEVVDLEICEASFSVTIQDTIVITEALSNGVIYQVTATSVDGGAEKSIELINKAC